MAALAVQLLRWCRGGVSPAPHATSSSRREQTPRNNSSMALAHGFDLRHAGTCQPCMPVECTAWRPQRTHRRVQTAMAAVRQPLAARVLQAPLPEQQQQQQQQQQGYFTLGAQHERSRSAAAPVPNDAAAPVELMQDAARAIFSAQHWTEVEAALERASAAASAAHTSVVRPAAASPQQDDGAASSTSHARSAPPLALLELALLRLAELQHRHPHATPTAPTRGRRQGSSSALQASEPQPSKADERHAFGKRLAAWVQAACALDLRQFWRDVLSGGGGSSGPPAGPRAQQQDGAHVSVVDLGEQPLTLQAPQATATWAGFPAVSALEACGADAGAATRVLTAQSDVHHPFVAR